MEYWKEVFAGFQTRFRIVTAKKKGVIYVTDFLFNKAIEVTIGNTTYLVSSFFKNDGKGNAVDKVRRLIERDAEK